MMPREMLDSLSDTLMCDERILSLPERALLTNLLRRAKGHAKPWDDAIAEAIARVVGETIVERACTILGSSVVQRLIEQPSTLTGSLEVHPTWPVGLATPPHPQGPQPSGPDPPAPRASVEVRPYSF